MFKKIVLQPIFLEIKKIKKKRRFYSLYDLPTGLMVVIFQTNEPNQQLGLEACIVSSDRSRPFSYWTRELGGLRPMDLKTAKFQHISGWAWPRWTSTICNPHHSLSSAVQYILYCKTTYYMKDIHHISGFSAISPSVIQFRLALYQHGMLEPCHIHRTLIKTNEHWMRKTSAISNSSQTAIW